MTTHTSSRLTAMRARIKRMWSELDYANRRMLDIRTGEYFMTGGRKNDSSARMPQRPAARAD